MNVNVGRSLVLRFLSVFFFLVPLLQAAPFTTAANGYAEDKRRFIWDFSWDKTIAAQKPVFFRPQDTGSNTKSSLWNPVVGFRGSFEFHAQHTSRLHEGQNNEPIDDPKGGPTGVGFGVTNGPGAAGLADHFPKSVEQKEKFKEKEKHRSGPGI